MKPVLEDLYMGPSATPSLPPGGFRWEDARRRVRVLFNGATVADSKRVMLLAESGRLPVFYFPTDDVQMQLLETSSHSTTSPLKGDATYWSVRVGDRVAENAAWSYLDPLPNGPNVRSYMGFYWNQMDEWYEEDERVYAHARDPYKRVDVLPSSRHVRVVLNGETVADSQHPYLLIETGLPTRYYLPQQDVRMDRLTPTDTMTRCPYKGRASYWTATVGGRDYRDIVWTYADPLPACIPVANLVCFFDERVDAVYVDDELQQRQKTPWSE